MNVVGGGDGEGSDGGGGDAVGGGAVRPPQADASNRKRIMLRDII
jgi:hypothetical protein